MKGRLDLRRRAAEEVEAEEGRLRFVLWDSDAADDDRAMLQSSSTLGLDANRVMNGKAERTGLLGLVTVVDVRHLGKGNQRQRKDAK